MILCDNVSMEINFSEWLIQQMDERGWTKADLTRNAKLSSGTISNIISGRRSPGIDTCRKIARAFQMPARMVLTAAGWVDAERGRTDSQDIALHLFNSLSEQDQAEVIEFMRMKKRMEKK